MSFDFVTSEAFKGINGILSDRSNRLLLSTASKSRGNGSIVVILLLCSTFAEISQAQQLQKKSRKGVLVLQTGQGLRQVRLCYGNAAPQLNSAYGRVVLHCCTAVRNTDNRTAHGFTKSKHTFSFPPLHLRQSTATSTDAACVFCETAVY